MDLITETMDLITETMDLIVRFQVYLCHHLLRSFAKKGGGSSFKLACANSSLEGLRLGSRSSS